MPTRTARTAWNGGLEDGSGQVELSSSKVGTYDVSFPKRAADDAGGTMLKTTHVLNAEPDFDPAYYLAHNPDVAAAGVDPLQHCLTYGWKEGRDPNAFFSTTYYLAQNPDVAAAHFVGGADGDAAAGAGFGAEVALFLYDDDDAVA